MFGITGLGSYAPPETGSNTPADLAVRAGRAALVDAGLEPADIGLLLCTGVWADRPDLATACRVQAGLGLEHAAATDVGGACAGFLFALRMAWNHLRAEPRCSHALVIGTETLARTADPVGRVFVTPYGDGAGAAVLGRVPEPYGLRHLAIGSDGAAGPTGEPGAPGGSGCARRATEREIAAFLTRRFEPLLHEAAGAEGRALADVDLVVPLQTDVRLLHGLAADAGIAAGRLVTIGDRYGNTGAASIPMALTAARNAGRLRHGTMVTTLAVGSGMTYANALIRWYDPRFPAVPADVPAARATVAGLGPLGGAADIAGILA